MSCCCNNVFDLGCHAACNLPPLPLVATEAGNYSVWVGYANGGGVVAVFQLAEGDQIPLPIGLNEQYTFLFKAYGPDGAQLAYEVDGVQYDCFQLKTRWQIQL